MQECIRQNYFRLCGKDIINYSDSNLGLILMQFTSNCGYKLPNTSRQIERLLVSFCYVFVELDQLKRFNDWKACFLVFNAMFMLNASLHSPTIKEKDKLKKNVFV